MKIGELYKGKRAVLSLEVFPPQMNYPLESVFETLDNLKELAPGFISVTYPGGANRSRTVEIAARIKKEYKVEALAHLTCVAHTRMELDKILDDLLRAGIENIVALRGDLPDNDPEYDFSRQEYRYAVELIRDARAKADFGIAAAAYPEGHPDSKRLSEDLFYLKQKVDAGVDVLITQLFFDNRVFYDFVEKSRRIGINVPIVPGIMPVLNAKQIRKMVYLGGTSIPPGMLRILEKYEDHPADMERAGIEYASEQIIDLLADKVSGIHLYTMNKWVQINEIVQNAGLI